MSVIVTTELNRTAKKLSAEIDYSRLSFWQRLWIAFCVLRSHTVTIRGFAVVSTRAEGLSS